MSITAVDHVVIAVRDIEEGIQVSGTKLGLSLSHIVDLDDAGLKQAFFALDDGIFIELIAPADDDLPVGEILMSRGEGVYVLALNVDDLDETVEAMQQLGVKLIGVRTPHVFFHPKSANGVMVQLWPKDRPHRWRDNPDEAGKQNKTGNAV